MKKAEKKVDKKEEKKDDDAEEEKPKKEEKKESAADEKAEAADKEVKAVTVEEISHKKILKSKTKDSKNKEINIDPNDRAIMITGETHARELLSAQVPLFLCLKLIHQGVMHDREKYQKMLRN